MQINKGNINLKEQVACANTTTLLEGDMVLADSFPDISEILCADAKVLVSDTVCKNGKACVSGIVEFTVLYMPDEENTELKCMSHDFEFSADLDIKADENTEFVTTANAEHIGFTLVNSRKLSAKVMVAIKTCSYHDKCYEPIIEMSGDDIEKIEKKYSIYIPMSQTYTDIEVNDLLTVPEDMPDIAEILKVDAWVTSGDLRVMNGKVMIQGEINLNTLYTASDDKGRVFSIHHKIPFTEIAEAPGADEQSVVNVSFDTPKISANIKGDLNGDTKIISTESKTRAHVKVFKTISETLIDDCYFLGSETKTSRQSMNICEYVTSENARIASRETAELPKNVKIKDIISCNATPILKDCKWEDGAAKVLGALITYLIYRDTDDTVRCSVIESELNWEKPIKDPCNIEASLRLEDTSVTHDETSVQVLSNVELYMKALKNKSVNILTECEPRQDDVTRTQPTMVIYFAKDGDTLWSIAKKYRTKSESIKQANNLETEKIESGKRLLVPIA